MLLLLLNVEKFKLFDVFSFDDWILLELWYMVLGDGGPDETDEFVGEELNDKVGESISNEVFLWNWYEEGLKCEENDWLDDLISGVELEERGWVGRGASYLSEINSEVKCEGGGEAGVFKI